MDDFDILPDTRGQHDTIHSKEDIQECYILKKTGSQDDQEPRYEALKFHFHCTDSRHPQPCYRKQGQVNELRVIGKEGKLIKLAKQHNLSQISFLRRPYLLSWQNIGFKLLRKNGLSRFVPSNISVQQRLTRPRNSEFASEKIPATPRLENFFEIFKFRG